MKWIVSVSLLCALSTSGCAHLTPVAVPLAAQRCDPKQAAISLEADALASPWSTDKHLAKKEKGSS